MHDRDVDPLNDPLDLPSYSSLHTLMLEAQKGKKAPTEETLGSDGPLSQEIDPEKASAEERPLFADVTTASQLKHLHLVNSLYEQEIPFAKFPNLETMVIHAMRAVCHLDGLERFEKIETLVLDGMSHLPLSEIAKVASLKHLRLLALTNYIGLNLPQEVAALRDLVELDVSLSSTVFLPSALFQRKELTIYLCHTAALDIEEELSKQIEELEEEGSASDVLLPT